MFGIVTSADYRKKVEADLADLRDKPADARAAMTAVVSLYHMHEWLWAKWLKDRRPVELDSATINSKTDLVRLLDANCPRFKLIQQLANGAKHALYVDAGGRIAGYGSGPYGIGPFGKPYLLIDLGKGNGTDRYLNAAVVILAAGEYMVDLSKRLGC